MDSPYSKLLSQTSLDASCTEEVSCHDHVSYKPKRSDLSKRVWIAIAVVSVISNVILVAIGIGQTNLARNHAPSSSSDQGRLYSPAQHVLRRVDRVFDSSIGAGVTAYQGQPNETNNKLWSNLYNDVGISRLSAEEARPLINHTLPIPGDQGHYIVSLSVFHQLHCLNMIRLALYKKVDWTNEDELFGIEHLDHCIDVIRQVLQCNADITPLPFIWSYQRNRALEEARAIHTCVDFDAIHKWADDHRMKIDFNWTAKVADDPLGWGSGVHHHHKA